MNSDFSADILKSALENPEMISKAMNIARSLAETGIFSGVGAENEYFDKSKEETEFQNESAKENTKEKSEPSRKNEEESKAEKPSSNNCKSDGISSEKRLRLLEALKPFLPEDKRGRVDMVIKIIRLLNTLDIKLD